ncbi:MAG: HEAT repeat domain-containing protein [Candidatus Micrarchaeota archaeon]
MGEIAKRMAELGDGDAQVRMNAAAWLGDIRESRALPGLLGLLRDRDWRVAGSAIEALGKIGDVGTIPALFEACEGSDVNRYTEISFALIAIAKADPQRMESAIQTIGHEGGKNENPRRREVRAWVLMNLEHPAAVPHLIDGLQDDLKGVRYNCEAGLIALAGKAVIGMDRVTESLAKWTGKETVKGHAQGEAAARESWSIFKNIKNAVDAAENRRSGARLPRPKKLASPPGKTVKAHTGRTAI